MKTLIRISVVTALLSLLGSGMYAQISIGLRGGVNFAKWKLNTEDTEQDLNDYLKYMTAPYISVPVELSLSNNFAIQLEPSYLQQGTRTYIKEEESFESGIIELEFESKMRINYIALPAMAKGKFSAGKVRLYVMGGPQVAYAIDGKVKAKETLTINGESETEESSESIDWDDSALTRFDFSLVFAGGLELPLGPGAVIFDARYLLGLQNLNKEKDDLFDQKIYNRGIGLSAGYRIPLGK